MTGRTSYRGVDDAQRSQRAMFLERGPIYVDWPSGIWTCEKRASSRCYRCSTYLIVYFCMTRTRSQHASRGWFEDVMLENAGKRGECVRWSVAIKTGVMFSSAKRYVRDAETDLCKKKTPCLVVASWLRSGLRHMSLLLGGEDMSPFFRSHWHVASISK